MQCSGCGTAFGAEGVFPGGRVRCPACGAENEAGPLQKREPHDPYRAASPPEAEPSSVPPRTTGLGPLCPRCPRMLVEDVALLEQRLEAALRAETDRQVEGVRTLMTVIWASGNLVTAVLVGGALLYRHVQRRP